MKERKAYVILVLISVFLSVAAFLAGVQEIQTNNHKFCQIIDSALSVPAPKPVHPAQNQSRERAYESYQRVLKLGEDLGCTR